MFLKHSLKLSIKSLIIFRCSEGERDPQMPGLADMSDNSSHTAKCWSQSQNTWSRNHCRTQTRRCWVIIQQKCFKIHFAGFTMETCNWVALAILTDWIEKFKRWGHPEINLKTILIQTAAKRPKNTGSRGEKLSESGFLVNFPPNRLFPPNGISVWPSAVRWLAKFLGTQMQVLGASTLTR